MRRRHCFAAPWLIRRRQCAKAATAGAGRPLPGGTAPSSSARSWHGATASAVAGVAGVELVAEEEEPAEQVEAVEAEVHAGVEGLREAVGGALGDAGELVAAQRRLDRIKARGP
ncbi:hypothetical protein [Kitasatospora aureofaciens]|uniref:hypothetical protein n=1 Tax=Kitasatospora aureofaciens TaxID=1894 RepID=UPI0036F4872C